MIGSYYTIFRTRPEAGPDVADTPPGIRMTWWEADWTHVFPPKHANARFFMLWLLSRLHMFRNGGYTVLLIDDDQGRLVHRTCILPAWFQFPFMRAADLQLGDIFTVPEWRRRGISLFALRYCLQRLHARGGYIYYVARCINLSSHRLALKSGFQFLSLCIKHPSKPFGYYSLIRELSDYSFVSRVSDPRLSGAQIERRIQQRVLSDQGRKPSDGPPVVPDSQGPLRILAVIPTSDSPSAMIFAHRQMAAMAAHGHEVQVFELSERRNLLTLFFSVCAYRTRLRSFRPEVVHAHYGAMTGFFSVYGAMGLVPVIVSFRGSDLNPVPSMPFWKVAPSHILSRLAALAAAHVVCVSAELRDRLWIAQQKAALIPTGVDTTRFYPLDRDVARQALGWDTRTPVVLFNAGSSPRVKRLDVAEQAIAIARKSFDALKFVVMDGNVPPDNVPTLMQASDCLLFTSDFEGSPTVIQEAMACNLPVVSVPVGDVPERLQDVTPSYLVSLDPEKLAEAMVRILRERRRSNGYEIAIRELGNEVTSNLLEQVYLHVVGRSGDWGGSALKPS